MSAQSSHNPVMAEDHPATYVPASRLQVNADQREYITARGHRLTQPSLVAQAVHYALHGMPMPVFIS